MCLFTPKLYDIPSKAIPKACGNTRKGQVLARLRPIRNCFHEIDVNADFDYPMKLLTYVNYGGNCREAFRFYEEHLGGQITMMMTHGEQPNPNEAPPGWKEKILHARMNIGETELLGSDVPAERFQPMRSVYLSLILDSVDVNRMKLRVAVCTRVIAGSVPRSFTVAARIGAIRLVRGVDESRGASPYALGRSLRSIQEVPNLSLSIAKWNAKRSRLGLV